MMARLRPSRPSSVTLGCGQVRCHAKMEVAPILRDGEPDRPAKSGLAWPLKAKGREPKLLASGRSPRLGAPRGGCQNRDQWTLCCRGHAATDPVDPVWTPSRTSAREGDPLKALEKTLRVLD